MNTYQKARLQSLVESQPYILSIDQLTPIIFVVTYKNHVAIPIKVTTMGLLKTLAYDMVYHADYKVDGLKG